MLELDEVLAEQSPAWILARAHYGGFIPTHDYFRFDDYGNLESSYYRDYSEMLDKYVIEDIIKYAPSCFLPEEVMEIIESEETDE